jgi:hypothetical protein
MERPPAPNIMSKSDAALASAAVYIRDSVDVLRKHHAGLDDCDVKAG